MQKICWWTCIKNKHKYDLIGNLYTLKIFWKRNIIMQHCNRNLWRSEDILKNFTDLFIYEAMNFISSSNILVPQYSTIQLFYIFDALLGFVLTEMENYFSFPFNKISRTTPYRDISWTLPNFTFKLCRNSPEISCFTVPWQTM